MIEIPNSLMERALFDDDALIELSRALRRHGSKGSTERSS